jgi:EAL domain-containing protein (putative c-di-GMP-specific phosphodiesterase class I)
VFAEARLASLGAELEIATLEAAVAAAQALPVEAWLSLSVSPGMVDDPRLRRVLRGVDRPVALEITEHTQVDDYAGLRTAIERLRPRVRVAVDAAGAGVTNFNHIVELRPAFVKLDMSLVRGIHADRTRQAMVLGLQQFAQEAESETIAEGVETPEELEMIRQLGVRLVQGYLLARPGPADAWSPERRTSGRDPS